MADTQRSQEKKSSLKNLEQKRIDTFRRLKTAVQRYSKAMTAMIYLVTNFFTEIFVAFFAAYERVVLLIIRIVGCVQQIFHFDYKGYLMWLLTMPVASYNKCKEQMKQHLWMPIAKSLKRRANQITRATGARLRASAVYARGFCEICRRLFLLASDYTPGGKVTVTIFLVVIAIMLLLKILTVVRVLMQIVQIMYSVVAFLLHPLLLTLKDILSVFDPLFHIILNLIRITVHTILSLLKATGRFLWLNIVSISSGLYRCWKSFANSTVVRFLWNTILAIFSKTAYVLLDKFFTVFLPLTLKISYYTTALCLDISSVVYENFFVVTVKVEDKFEYLSPSGIGSCVFMLWALLIAFRFRNRLSGTFFSEIDDKEYAITSSRDIGDRDRNSSSRGRSSYSQGSAKYDSLRRKMSCNDSSVRFRGTTTRNEEKGPENDDQTEGHIHYSSQVHICPDFITGTCHQGSKCESHHCPLPYHWQYRLSLEGWKSFTKEDNCRIEELFCDPKNDVVSAADIDVAFKSYSGERSSSRNDAVKVDFDNMRIEKSYHRADLRRLSTESYVKQEGKRLSTQWLWYRKEESGDWIKYGVTTGESDLKQEDLETAFLRGDGNYTFTRNGQEFRLQFFMNPMCEKSFRPYSKKTVRRRPAYESPEDVKTLLRSNVEKKSWFSLRNLFRWR